MKEITKIIFVMAVIVGCGIISSALAINGAGQHSPYDGSNGRIGKQILLVGGGAGKVV